MLQGYPDPNTLGVAAASLHCNSSSPVVVGINSTYLGTYESHFTGVRLISSSDCQQKVLGWSVQNQTRPPLFALLYFCGNYQITLAQPAVHNVTLTYTNPAWNSAIVACGGQTVVHISQGRFIGNKAGSTLAALQHASLTLQENTVLDHNSAAYGAGVLALEQASVVIQDTTLRSNHATWGGSVGCAHNASIIIHNSSLYKNAAQQEGGAVAVDCSGQVSRHCIHLCL